jgi:tRNA (guanosine-2'-O-)-methyltransferase
MTEVKRLNRDWRRRTRARLGLLLDGDGQPFNVGAIIRTAAAFGVDQVWLCGNTAPPAHPSARKTALGTDRLLAIEHLPSANAAVQAARADGYRVIAIELASEAVPLHAAPLSAALLAMADAIAYIPLPGKVGSLNVAAATAIALAETRRHDWTSETGR